MQYFAKTKPEQVLNTPKPSLCQFWLSYHCNFAAPFCFFAQLCQLVTDVNNSNSVKAIAIKWGRSSIYEENGLTFIQDQQEKIN